MSDESAGFKYIAWARLQPRRHKMLKARETLLLYVLATHADVDGYAWPKAETLCDECGYGPKTLTAAVKGLVAHGLIDFYRRQHQSTKYRLLRDNTPPLENSCAGCASARGDDSSKRTRVRIEKAVLHNVPETHTGADRVAHTHSDVAPHTGADPRNAYGCAPIKELPEVELPVELPRRTSTARDARAGIPISTEEEQTAARAWVERHRATWPGIDDHVAVSVYVAALRGGQPPESSHVHYADRWGLDALSFCFQQEEAA